MRLGFGATTGGGFAAASDGCLEIAGLLAGLSSAAPAFCSNILTKLFVGSMDVLSGLCRRGSPPLSSAPPSILLSVEAILTLRALMLVLTAASSRLELPDSWFRYAGFERGAVGPRRYLAAASVAAVKEVEEAARLGS